MAEPGSQQGEGPQRNALSPEEIRQFVQQELIASEVRKALRENDETPSFRMGAILRHPAALLVIGALATGVIGTLLSQYWDARSARKTERFAAEGSLQELQELAETARIRAAFVRSAIVNDLGGDKLSARKKSWDDAYIAWQSGWRARTSEIDTFLGWSQDSPLTDAVEDGIASVIREQDNCLTKAWLSAEKDLDFHDMRKFGLDMSQDVYIDAEAILKNCFNRSHEKNESNRKDKSPLEDATNRFRDCAREAARGIRQFIARDLHCRSSAWEIEHGNERSDILKTARAMVGFCWGDPEKFESLTLVSGADFEDRCWIRDTLWNRATGLVQNSAK